MKKRKQKQRQRKQIDLSSEPQKFANAAMARRLRVKDNVNTDYIISGRYKFSISDPKELSRYVFNDIEPDFGPKIKPGDFLIAGENFGCGSSREQAPLALKSLGLKAVVAKSFARIFYRNSFNVGLLLLECNTNYIDDGDALEYDSNKNILKNLSKGLFIDIKPIPAIAKRLIEDDGVIGHFKKYGEFRIEP